jgi:methyl-accepting chemotaxis protein
MPLTDDLTELLGKIMAQLLSILALSTKAMTDQRISELLHSQRVSFLAYHGTEKLLKKLAGGKEIEAAVSQLDTLTKEESLMISARNLEVTHRVDGNVEATKVLTENIGDNVKAMKALTEDVDDNVKVIGDNVKVTKALTEEVGDSVKVIGDDVKVTKALTEDVNDNVKATKALTEDVNDSVKATKALSEDIRDDVKANKDGTQPFCLPSSTY